MRITYDPRKRAETLAQRHLDFEDAARVFDGVTIEFEDTRADYRERRMICYGRLGGRTVVIVYTSRGDTRHVISMRKANEREKARIATFMEK